MAATVIDEGRDVLTKRLLGQSVTVNLSLKLFVNNHNPATSDTNASYTECSTAGYAAVALTATTWTGSTTGGVATYTYTAITFTFSANAGGVTVYGYWVQETSATKAVWADKFASVYNIPAAGGSVTVNLTWIDQ